MSIVTIPDIPPHPNLIDGMTWTDMEKNAIKEYAARLLSSDVKQARHEGYAEGWNACRAAIIKVANKRKSLK